MKKITIYLFAAIFALLFNSCRDDDPSGQTIFVPSDREQTQFEVWLENNYALPYNIDFKYRMEDIESSMTHTLIPATEDNAIKLAKIVKHVWLGAYDEVAGVAFTRQYVPKVIHLVGSAAWNAEGTRILGTAEGGMKITLYEVNNLQLNADYLNRMYLHTMHHEFAHILHQTRLYTPEFKKVTPDDYIGDNWYLTTDSVARTLGFISNYARKNYDEDFVETLAWYVVNTQDKWDEYVNQGGVEGKELIENKLEIVTNYLNDSWEIDINELRAVVLERTNSINDINFKDLN